MYSYVGLCRAMNPKAEWAIDAEALRAKQVPVSESNGLKKSYSWKNLGFLLGSFVAVQHVH